jgi:arabinose-5-phosphate isomerase
MSRSTNLKSQMSFEPNHVVGVARKAITTEIDELERLRERLADEFVDAVTAVINCTGRVVVMGIGKSGHIGRKIASTLASTGTPAFFVHPAEASHGDLGMISNADMVLAISNSGETGELLAILPILKRQGVKIISMTSRRDSSIALHADIFLDSSVSREACPLNLAPTASTAVQLALGDALAIVLLDARGFNENDFARSHPGGSLGRRLLTRVSDVMRRGSEVPRVRSQASFMDVMREMSQKGLGATGIIDDKGGLLGIFTDGDLRRLIEVGLDFRTSTAESLMKSNPRTIQLEALAVNAVQIMEQEKISCLLVLDEENRLVGATSLNDLMRAKMF